MGTTSNELPLPDYDHLPVSSLQHRIRSLGQDDLRALRGYENEHANRVAVLEMIDARIDALEHGAQPSGGDPTGRRPEQPDGVDGGPAVTSRTAAPPGGPPPHGTPAQPARPKADRQT
jgi:hypothetical protein